MESCALLAVVFWLGVMTVGGFKAEADRRADAEHAKAHLEKSLDKSLAEQKFRSEERHREHTAIHADINKTREMLRAGIEDVKRACAEKKAACLMRLRGLWAAADGRARTIEAESSTTEAYRRALGSAPVWEREALAALEEGLPDALPGFRALGQAPKGTAGGKAVADWYAARSSYLKNVLAGAE